MFLRDMNTISDITSLFAAQVCGFAADIALVSRVVKLLQGPLVGNLLLCVCFRVPRVWQLIGPILFTQDEHALNLLSRNPNFFRALFKHSVLD